MTTRLMSATTDVDCAGFYLTDADGNETELEVPEVDESVPVDDDERTELDDNQYVKYVCWRTTEWVLTSERPVDC